MERRLSMSRYKGDNLLMFLVVFASTIARTIQYTRTAQYSTVQYICSSRARRNVMRAETSAECSGVHREEVPRRANRGSNGAGRPTTGRARRAGGRASTDETAVSLQ